MSIDLSYDPLASVERLKKVNDLPVKVNDDYRKYILGIDNDEYAEKSINDEKMILSFQEFTDKEINYYEIDENPAKIKEGREKMVKKIREKFSELKKWGWGKEEIERLDFTLSFLDYELLSSLSLDWWNFNSLAITELSQKLNLKQLAILGKISEIIGSKFSSDFVRYCDLVKKFDDYSTAEEFISGLDLAPALENKSADLAWTSGWINMKCAGLSAKVASLAPHASVKEKGLFPTATNYNNYERLTSLQSLSEMSAEGFDNLERLASSISDFFHISDGKKLRIFLESPHFDLVLDRIKKNSVLLDTMFEAKSDQLQNFMNTVSEDILRRYDEKPEYIKMKTIDIPIYFSDDSFSSRIEFAKGMRKIFGDAFEIPIAELFLVDPANDLKTIRELSEKCFLPLNAETLSMLKAYRASEALRESADRVMPLLKRDINFDVEKIVPHLKSLSGEKAKLALNENLKRLGWDILNYRSSIIDALQINDEEWKKILGKLFEIFSTNNLPEIIDFTNIKLLFEYLSESGGQKISKDSTAILISKFDEPARLSDFWKIIINKGWLVKFGVSISNLPHGLLNCRELWDALLTELPQEFVFNFRRIPVNFYSKEGLSRIAAELCDRIFDQPELNETHGLKEAMINIFLKSGVTVNEEQLDRLVFDRIKMGDNVYLLESLEQKGMFVRKYADKFREQMLGRFPEKMELKEGGESNQDFYEDLLAIFAKARQGTKNKINWFDERIISFCVKRPGNAEELFGIFDDTDETMSKLVFESCLTNLDKLVSLPQEKRKQYLSIIERIDSSPSQEIQRIKEQLLNQILEHDNPNETYNRIESVFIKNNLPLVGKIFRIFKILYPPEMLNEILKDPKLSPYLRS
ncbi:MAG: hypothetical protein ABII98_00060, partial [bacterium]